MSQNAIKTPDVRLDHFFGMDMSGPAWYEMNAGYITSSDSGSIVMVADEYHEIQTQRRISPQHVMWLAGDIQMWDYLN